MKYILFLLIVFVTFSISNCSSLNDDDDKIAQDTTLIHWFFDINNSENIEEASKTLSDSASFIGYVEYVNTSIKDPIDYYFKKLENGEFTEKSYVDLNYNLYQYFNKATNEKIIIIIDSIVYNGKYYRVYERLESPLCEEFKLTPPTKIEDFYINDGKITKVVQQEINISKKDHFYGKKLAYWVYMFTGKDAIDFNSLYLGTAEPEFEKMVIEKYKKLKSEEEKIAQEKQYGLWFSLGEAFEEAWMTSELDDVDMNFYLKFKRIDRYYDPVIEDEDDTTKLVHLFFADNSGTEIACVTRNQDISAFSYLKPDQMCSVYGVGTKNTTGELQLKDVVVLSY